MNYRSIPDIPVSVSEVGFGVWSVATPWWGVKDDQLAQRLLRMAYSEYGITFFDTADVYGQGKGENILAESLRDVRQKIVIATKFGYDIYAKRGDRHGGHTELPQYWNAASIRKSCEESLTRLKTDYIDLYQLHNPRMEAIQSDEVYETLQKLQEEGKILTYGVALGPDIGWEKEGIESIKAERMKVAQIINNLVEQDPARELISTAKKNDFPLIVRVPHASGILDGTYNPDSHFDKTDHRSHRPKHWMEAGLNALREYQFLVNETGRTIGQAAILFSLAYSQIKSVLPNITNEQNLHEFALASTKKPLSHDEVQKINELWDGHQHVSLSQPFSNSQTKPTPIATPAGL